MIAAVAAVVHKNMKPKEALELFQAIARDNAGHNQSNIRAVKR